MRKPKEIHTCVICGKEFTHKRRKKNLCCSEACGAEYTKRTRSKPKEYRICQFCGKTFEIKRRDIQNIYCSHDCQIEGLKATGKEKRRQRDKEKQVQIEQRERDLLLKRIVKQTKSYYAAQKRTIDLTVQCAECGEIFQAKTLGTQFCPKCRRKRHNRRKDKRLKRCSVVDHSINLMRLYMRDHGVCQICGKPLTMEGDTNSPDYPSIDHIIPISKGGDHTWENVQLACRRCNTIKRDIPPPEGG